VIREEKLAQAKKSMSSWFDSLGLVVIDPMRRVGKALDPGGLTVRRLERPGRGCFRGRAAPIPRPAPLDPRADQ